MADVVTVIQDNRVVVEVAGADLASAIATAAVAEMAAQVASDLEDIQEIASGAPDAPSILNKLNKDGDNADVGLLANIGAVASADLADDTGAGLVGRIDSGTGAVARTVTQVLSDYSNSVVGYGAVADGTTDNTTAFENAMLAHLGKRIFVPPGTGAYVVGNVGSIGLAVAGTGIEGVSGFQTIIKAKAGLVANSALFRNINAGTSGTSYLRFADLRFDLGGQNVIAIDLSHCDTCVVERVNGQGGTSLGTAAGTLVKFGAPTDSSSYNNVVRDCAGSYFGKAILFGLNANQNRIDGGSYTLNDTAIDCAPGGVLLRPQLLGVRIEGNNIGVKEGAQGGVYLGYFEDNANGDFDFTTDSEDCVILPGTITAVTGTPLTNRANATNLRCLSDDLGYFDIQDSASRIRQEQGRTVRSASGQALDAPVPSGIDFTDLHADPVLISNASGVTAAAGFEAVNGAGTNTVLLMNVDVNNRLNIASFNRATGTYTRIFVGPDWNFNPSVGLEYAGVKVLGARGAAVTAPTGGATIDAEARTAINAILARIGPAGHGLIS